MHNQVLLLGRQDPEVCFSAPTDSEGAAQTLFDLYQSFLDSPRCLEGAET